MKEKGFAVQINKFMQSSYAKRLNIDLDHLSEENILNIFGELLSLLDLRRF